MTEQKHPKNVDSQYKVGTVLKPTEKIPANEYWGTTEEIFSSGSKHSMVLTSRQEGTMDMRALKVGQRVTLSAALPRVGTEGIVIALSKWSVYVQVPVEIVEGGYCIAFEHSNDIYMFYGWLDKGEVDRYGWCMIDFACMCPIPDLRIVGILE